MATKIGKETGMKDNGGNMEACEREIVQMKGHDRKDRIKDDVDVMRYSQMGASGKAWNSTGYFSGLGDDVVHVTAGDALHGDVGVRAPALLLRSTGVRSSALQVVGVCAAPGAVVGGDAGAGGGSGAQSRHTGTGHCEELESLFD